MALTDKHMPTQQAYTFLGFGFDGFGDYENYSETNPEAATLTMLPEPRFESIATNEVIQFDPRKQTELHFKVYKQLCIFSNEVQNR